MEESRKMLIECSKLFDVQDNHLGDHRDVAIKVYESIKNYDTHNDKFAKMFRWWLLERYPDCLSKYHFYLVWFAMRELLVRNFELPSFDDIVDFAIEHPDDIRKCFNYPYKSEITREAANCRGNDLRYFFGKIISVARVIKRYFGNEFHEHIENVPIDFHDEVMHVQPEVLAHTLPMDVHLNMLSNMNKPDVNDINNKMVILDISNTYLSTFLDIAVDMLEDRKREQKKYTSENIDKFVSSMNTLQDRLSKYNKIEN